MAAVLAALGMARAGSVLVGCSADIVAQVDRSLEDSIERAQDALWEYRAQIASDPETAVTELSFVVDYRDGVGG